MKITLVGPGIMPIPPTGWGAVEILIWDSKNALEALGHTVQIINTKNGREIIHQINSFKPDFDAAIISGGSKTRITAEQMNQSVDNLTQALFGKDISFKEFEVIVDDMKGFYNALFDFVVKGFYDGFETSLFCKFIDVDGNEFKSDIDDFN